MDEKTVETSRLAANPQQKSFVARAASQLYVQTLAGVVLGALVGWLDSGFGKGLKPLGEAFVNLIKMMIGPIIFCTIAQGSGRFRSVVQKNE